MRKRKKQEIKQEIKQEVKNDITELLKVHGVELVDRMISDNSFAGTYTYTKSVEIEKYEILQKKFDALLKHLKIEYYHKEIKEKNGKEIKYIEEGFRKPTKGRLN